jgi:cation:H+ antiporter
MTDWLLLAAMLILIVVAAEIFTNALEHLGEKLHISEGVTGSLFAAVATAMPESIVPLVAFMAGTGDAHVNQEIGVGAILGAPLMLSTLALCFMALSVAGRRGLKGSLNPERTGLRRDLQFFLIAFGLALAALFLPEWTVLTRTTVVVALIFLYFIYVLMTLRVSAQLVANGHGTEAHSPMFICRFGLPETMRVVVLQLVLGFVLLIVGAKGFVHGVEHLSVSIGVSPLVLSLLLVPIATELPEKVNSILWIRRGKDTLAFGNITGAMVFQGSLLPAIGIAMTPWHWNFTVLTGIVITLAGAIWLLALSYRGTLQVWHLFVNGGLYVVYLLLLPIS